MDPKRSTADSRGPRAVLVTLSALAFAGVVAWLYSAPYRTLSSIRDAGLEKDTERLAELVDFPSVREHLKEQLNAAMAQSLAQSRSSETDNSPFAQAGRALGMMLAKSMVDTLVDAMASPSGIAAMTRGTKPSVQGASTPRSGLETSVVTKSRYDSMSRFTIRFLDSKSGSTQVALHLRRYGFLWRLTSVDMPTLADANNPVLRSDGEAAKRTVADIRNVGTAMMSWLTDQISAAAAGQSTIATSSYPPTSSGSIASVLVPKYIDGIPSVDGWGNPYEYYLELHDFSKKRIMMIRSAGRDGKFDSEAYAPGPFDPDDPDQDIVWADGFFVRWPQRSSP